MTQIQQLLRQNMKEARKRFGYSQMKLAELCGVPTSFIGEIEIGRKFPSVNSLQKIADTLHMKPFELFLDTDDKHQHQFNRYEVLSSLQVELQDRITSDIADVVKKYLR